MTEVPFPILQRKSNTSQHARYRKPLKWYAKKYGTTDRAIKRWIRIGKIHGELPPLDGYRVYVRDYCRVRSWLQQRVRWEPHLRLLRVRAVLRRAGSCAPIVEQITERAFSATELGKLLAGSGFVIRGVHDEATLRTAVDCPARIIVVAQKAPGRLKSN